MKVEKRQDDDLEVIQLFDTVGDMMEVIADEDYDTLSFDMSEDYCEFTRDQMKDLLPHLAAWCETGSLEVSDGTQ